MKMKLDDHQFHLIKIGIKKIEVRLNDNKRKKLLPGEIIEFTNIKSKDTLSVQVYSIEYFDTFKDLYLKYSGPIIGSDNNDSLNKMLCDTYNIYDNFEEEKFGVIAIHLNDIKH